MDNLVIPPRSEGKRNADIKNIDLYKYYKANMPEIESLAGGKTSGSYNITAKEYATILKDINNNIIDIVIMENFEFKLPYGLGLFSVTQKPIKLKLDKDGNLSTKNLSVDYKATKALWNSDKESFEKRIKIFHTNDHSNNNRMSYTWSRKKSYVLGIRAYYFVACRQVKRRLPKLIKEFNLTFFMTPLTKSEKNERLYNIKNK